jgi:hypothetical protein
MIWRAKVHKVLMVLMVDWFCTYRAYGSQDFGLQLFYASLQRQKRACPEFCV